MQAGTPVQARRASCDTPELAEATASLSQDLLLHAYGPVTRASVGLSHPISLRPTELPYTSTSGIRLRRIRQELKVADREARPARSFISENHASVRASPDLPQAMALMLTPSSLTWRSGTLGALANKKPRPSERPGRQFLLPVRCLVAARSEPTDITGEC
jgi:hypothetical protein